MALIKCPECQKEISDSAVSCPNCGHRLKAMSDQTKKIIIAFVIVVIISFGFYGIYKYNENYIQEQSESASVSDKIATAKSKMDAASEIYEKTLDKNDLQKYEDAFDEYKRALGY